MEQKKRPPNSLDCRRTVKVVRLALSSSSFIAGLALFFKKSGVMVPENVTAAAEGYNGDVCEKWPRPLDESF